MKSTLLAAVLCAIYVCSVPAFAQTDSTFTYQGQLSEAGAPANGSYSMRFKLFDAIAGGSQIGSTVTIVAQAVSDGIFSSALDFGAQDFSGTQYWLEIMVDGNTLSPRQPMTPSPFSIQTRGIFVDDVGNVGIGTDNPTRPLTVRGDSSWMLGLEGPQNPGLRIAADNSGSLGASWAMYQDSATGNLLFRDSFDAINRLSIDGVTGNVGIGTDNPTRNLFIEGGGANTFIGMNSTSQTGLLFGSSVLATDGGIVFNTLSNPRGLDFRTAGNSTRMSIDDAGNVGIGTTDPAAKLDVVGNAAISGSLSLADNNHIIGVGAPFNNVALRINSVEEIGLYLDFGEAAKPGGGSWTATSDERLKTNIHDLDGALDTLLSLRGVTYEYKDPDAIGELHGTRTGFIAQEAEQVIPDWVWDAEDGYKRMTIRGFEALAVEAIREQQEQIAALQSQIESLKGGGPVMGASMAWPMLIGGGLMGGFVIVRRRMSNS